MKKTYITPDMLSVTLNTKAGILLQESLTINTEGGEGKTITGSEQILTKESRDINLWDNEW
ncbi:MAG: hypothetical protein IKM68_06275 [Bacteroidaceae bacterium]|nr:hypothetical protein [Bacteroidaceae bacterium]